MAVHTLMFGWEYPPRSEGGLGVACQGLVRGLLLHGVKVTLVLPSPHAETEEDMEILYPTEKQKQNVYVKSMLNPYDSRETYANRIRNIPCAIHHIYGDDLDSAIRMFTDASVEITKNIRPDVVHCHDWMTYEAGLRSARHHRTPLVAHIHATELDRTNFHPNQWIYDLERRGFHAADRIIAVSNYTKDILTEHYGIAADKIAVVHNGNAEIPSRLRSEYQRKKNAPPIVLFLGRLTIQKGPWQFLDMATEVHKHRPDVQFVMAGNGYMLQELIQRTVNLGLADCVIFTGKASREDVRHLFRHADCFVMPSLSEPFGLVALEAIANGAPVILSKQSGVSEVVDHAFKVDFWDTEKMADCVLTILREQPLALQMRSEAPRILQRLTWQNQACLVKSVYEHLVTA